MITLLRFFPSDTFPPMLPGQVHPFHCHHSDGLPQTGGIITHVWFKESSVSQFLDKGLYVRFLFHGARVGHVAWDWIPLVEAAKLLSERPFPVEMRGVERWLLEFLADQNNESKIEGFSPALWMKVQL